MLSKALEMGVCVHRSPLLGNMEGHSFPRAFERGDTFLYLGNIFMGNLRDVLTKRPSKRAALYIGALLGNLEGVRLLGIFTEKEKGYLGSFSWTQRTLKVKSGSHLEL
jgi:hypothetical protein